jgi:hypothetical protein
VPDRIKVHAELMQEAQQRRNRLRVSKESPRLLRVSTPFVADPYRSVGRSERLDSAHQHSLLVSGSYFVYRELDRR